MITIVDYGIGNIASVKNMLYKNGAESETSSDPEVILKSDKIILPGVGAFDTAVNKLDELNLIPIIREFAKSGKPLLGICLGAQLLLNKSEEGVRPGLQLIAGSCMRFSGIQPLRIPHMSWTDVTFVKQNPLTRFSDAPRFYFVHSYHMVCDRSDDVFGVANYGNDFTCAIAHDNIYGVQFHPEKSHRFGSQFLKNFVEL